MEVSLKLMVNKEKNKVVFAEAGKDFVDVLFSFLTLPLGTIVRLVGKEESDMQPVKVGSLSSLYESVVNLDKEYLSTATCKDMLLQPRNSMEAYCKNMKLNIDDTKPTRYFVCDNLVNCRSKARVDASTFENKICRDCGSLLSKMISPQSPIVFQGFVKSNVAFLITDDLKIVPNSLGTMFTLLKSCGAETVPAMEEMNVNVTKKQVLDLLKSCLFSKTTLTDVFLEKKLAFERFEQANHLSNFEAKGGSQINVKVMQRKTNGEIVFAQGKEDFADFLYSLLTFPLGGVVHLLEGYSSMGSVDGLYESIVSLSEDYFMSKEVKDMLVFPGLAPQFKLSNQIIPIHESDAPIYFCYTNSYKPRKKRIVLSDYYLTSTRKGDSGVCSFETCNVLNMVDPISKSGSAKGFAKGPTMYLATDDLVVRPMSSISVISLLNSMNIPLSDLEEKVVSIGINEGLRILKASLISTSSLTNGLSIMLTKVKEEN